MQLPTFMPRAFALLLGIAGMPAVAADYRLDLLGDPAPPAASGRSIVIRPDTTHVHVTGGEIVRFVVGDQAFAWHFSGPPMVNSFLLNRVAPPGLLTRPVTANVTLNPLYLNTD